MLVSILATTLLLHPAPPRVVEVPSKAEIIKAAQAMNRKAEGLPRLVGAAMEAGVKFDVDPIFLLAVAYAESRWTLKAEGDRGHSHGAWQLTRGAASSVGWAGVLDGKARRAERVATLRNAHTSALIAAAFIARLRKRYTRPMVVYNCGPIRCGRGKARRRSTRATRAYWRYYRRLQRIIEEGQHGK